MSSTTRMATSAMITALTLTTLISACQTAMSASFPHSAVQAHATVTGETPAVHGMLVVGAQNLYVSHLPMFHAPHNAQAIAGVTLADPSGDVRARLAQDRAKTGETVYTLVPEPDRLTRLFTKGQTYPATLYRGHFERGGTPVLGPLTVTVKQVVHYRTFTPKAGTGMQPQWLLFGTPQEPFAAHWISAPPDLDQVVALKAPGLDPAVLAAGAPATLKAPLPLQQGGAHTATLAGKSWPVRVESAIYAETGDLAH